MLRPVESPINNATNDYSKQRVLAELRQNEAAPECLRQYLEHERPGTEGLMARDSRLTFLDSHKVTARPEPDLQSLEREIRPLLQSRPTSSQPAHDPTLPKGALWENSGSILKSLPFYTSWFDFEKVHSIERQNLPEFFGEKPSKTPRIYQRARNFLIHLYWRNPRSPLHATTARRCVALDAPSVARIHSFLEKWGLINLQSKNKTVVSHEETALDFIQPDAHKPLPPKNTMPRETTFELSVIEAAFAHLGAPRLKCFQCQQPLQLSWASQRRSQRHSEDPQNTLPTLQTGLNLCHSCFGQNNYPVYLNKRDFDVVTVRQFIEATIPDSERPPLSTQERVLSQLADSRLDHLAFPSLQSLTPEIRTSVLLATTLRILETKETDREVAVSGQVIQGTRTRNELNSKMTAMLESLLDKVSSGGTDNSHLSRSREHTLKPLMGFSREIAAAFAEKTEKTALRLAFLEDFEKILYQEKTNLKAFN